MIPIAEFNPDTMLGRVLVLDPTYPLNHLMRIRIIDAHFVKLCVDITHFLLVEDLEIGL
jgi:hypothetical protein